MKNLQQYNKVNDNKSDYMSIVFRLHPLAFSHGLTRLSRLCLRPVPVRADRYGFLESVGLRDRATQVPTWAPTQARLYEMAVKPTMHNPKADCSRLD